MSGRDAAISPVQDVLGQLDWLTAELEAQRPFLTRIPDVQLTARPLQDQPSLLGLYEEMLEREKGHRAVLGLSPSSAESDGIESVLDAILACRSDVLETLRSKAAAAWQEKVNDRVDETLLDWAYQITLADGDTLRTVAERLHESQLSLGGQRRNGS